MILLYWQNSEGGGYQIPIPLKELVTLLKSQTIRYYEDSFLRTGILRLTLYIIAIRGYSSHLSFAIG